MKSPLNIHPPKNWQDFETLCLKLFGEIWKIPHEIEFNSDNSQGQNGVDIYGAVDDGLKYNGIQCKNKKLNLINGSPNRITIKDIQAEIDKAKCFQPSLNKLVIATSLPKDQKIEEYVRKTSVENIKNGFFSIQICFWEFFERKLCEFPEVYNWYFKNEDFHKVKDISVTFKNGLKEVVCHPKFQKKITRYRLKSEVQKLEEEEKYIESLRKVFLEMKFPKKEIENVLHINRATTSNNNLNFNHALIGEKHVWGDVCWLKIQIKNSGQSVIEDYKITLDYEGLFNEVGAESKNILFEPKFTNNVKQYSNSKKSLYIKPSDPTLVPEDYFFSGNFYISPTLGIDTEVHLKWKLISRDFTDSGNLLIVIKPLYHMVYIDKEVGNIEDEKEEISYNLFERRGIRNFTGIKYLDKITDYKFE
ncbi:hypothetical protein MQX03_19530 [Chryseobacterium aahli]|uniref:hypothetical protein n=1 Tax=Chryseobacterium aahli TaxID=1278643 RepID=UPI001F623B72|nr:hypothetical protein [Chryseobacterium aahli]MCI3939372.1 hypothetical protein [Chryseobacterium aahli]